jgi:hypothetical protein
MRIQRCVDDLVKRGADDWIQAAEVAWVAKSIGEASTDTDVRDLALELIREVVQHGLMEIGEVAADAFRKCPLSPEEALSRVTREWMPLSGLPDLGDVCWLCNTEAGNERGEELLRQREAS